MLSCFMPGPLMQLVQELNVGTVLKLSIINSYERPPVLKFSPLTYISKKCQIADHSIS